jgi:hypothetical protein
VKPSKWLDYYFSISGFPSGQKIYQLYLWAHRREVERIDGVYHFYNKNKKGRMMTNMIT